VALLPRNALVLVFSLLLLGMQVEGQRHALTHLGGLLHRAHEQGVQQSVGDAPCIECELLASGSHLVASSIAALAHSGGAAELIAIAFDSFAVPAPDYYSSRASPVLL